ncbi:hypothetical protein [Limnobacter sp.]|uniref:hypothetical protein n=1 Tax=Limnobacter sp. TaxID=2003368 RepID=UPI0037479512
MQMIDFLLHFFALSLVIIPVMLPLSLTLLTWLTPQSVIDRYVCPPHFSEFESVAYRYFPTSWIRTLLFSMAISVPIFRRVRKFGPMHREVPRGFNIACRLFVYGVVGHMILFWCAVGFLLTFGKSFE